MSNECITIDSSDDDEVQVMDATTKTLPTANQENVKRRIELQPAISGKDAFIKLLTKCKEADPTNDMDIILKKMWKRFNEADLLYTSSSHFVNFIEKLIEGVPLEPYCQLKILSDELKYRTMKKRRCEKKQINPSKSEPNEENQMFDEKTQYRIRKLEKLIEKLHKIIVKLENQEVDSNDEENSAYIRVSKYKERLCQVYKKICELRNMSLMHNPLRSSIKFSGTKLPSLNRAIEKFYNERHEFPDFCDVLKVVQTVNSSKSLNLSPGECQVIAEKAFKELGETLKKQRQIEFHETIGCYMSGGDQDPSVGDPDLFQKLERNKQEYGNRIDEIIDKYALKQNEENLQPIVVPSDVSSGSEDEEESEDNVTSLSEPEADDESIVVITNNDNLPLSCDVKVVVTDLIHLPEWEKYGLKSKNWVSVSNKNVDAGESVSRCNNGLNANQCNPVAGCSKNILNDFCDTCLSIENKNDASHCKRSWSAEDDSELDSSKKAKLDAGKITLLDEANTNEKITTENDTEKFIKPKIFSVSSLSLEHIASGSSFYVNSTSDCESGKSSSNTSLIVNLSNGESAAIGENEKLLKSRELAELNNDARLKSVLLDKNAYKNLAASIHETSPSCHDNGRNVINVDDVSDHCEGIETNTEAVEAIKVDKISDRANPFCRERNSSILLDNNEDEVMIIDEVKSDPNPAAKDKNSVDVEQITNVDDIAELKKDNAKETTEKLSANRSNNAKNDRPEFIDIKKIDVMKKKQEEVIDVERLSDGITKTNGVPDINLSEFIRNIKLPLHRPRECSVSITPIRENARTPAVSNVPVNCENFRNQMLWRPRFSSTPKPFLNQKNNVVIYPQYGRNMSMQKRKPLNQNQLGSVNRRFEIHRVIRPPYTANRNIQQHFQQAAMQKRTTQTTERKIVKNNIVTRTTTVVEESVMRMDSNNGQGTRFAMGQNARLVMQGRCTARKHTQYIHKFRKTDVRNSSTDDVITLD